MAGSSGTHKTGSSETKGTAKLGKAKREKAAKHRGGKHGLMELAKSVAGAAVGATRFAVGQGARFANKTTGVGQLAAG